MKKQTKVIAVDLEAYTILSEAKLNYIKENPTDNATFSKAVKWMWKNCDL